MSRSSLACTVRACGLGLERRARVYVCPRGHAYDVARSGYVNLLQPQDRRSPAAGDSRAAVQARAQLIAAGVGAGILGEFVGRAASLDLVDAPLVVDLGSGGGSVLGALAARRAMTGVGIDLSIAAAELAARSFPALTWVVANADRRLPLLDGSVDLIISVHGRRNVTECARVLTRTGLLLVAVPAPDDLIELRHLVQGEAVARDRADAVLAEHAPHFTPRARFTARERHPLSRDALQALLRATYRGARRSVAGRVDALDEMEVTLASDMLLLAPRSGNLRGGERRQNAC